jgi:hypothetical protein
MLKALLLIAPLTNLLFLNKAIKKRQFLANETITDSNEIMRNYKITKLPFMASSMIMRFTISIYRIVSGYLMKSGCIKNKELNDYAITIL